MSTPGPLGRLAGGTRDDGLTVVSGSPQTRTVPLRDPIPRLLALGPLPSEEGASVEDVSARESLVLGIVEPVTDDEARALVALLGETEDSLYGLKWSLLHAIESSPGWPMWDTLRAAVGPWRDLLMTRLANGGETPPEDESHLGGR